MPTINYYYADVYPDQLEMPDFSVEISMEEYNRRKEQEHRWESDGRIAKREISVFDAMMAEIMDDRMAEKAKYRRQRKDARKYKELPEERKHRKERRKDRLFGYYYGPCIKVEGNPDSLPINHRRSAEAEKILRADWDTEIDAIIDDLDWAYMDMEYLDEKIEMLRHNLHVGDNYVRYNRLCERRNVVAEVIRKNRFVEEMLKGEC